MAELNYKRKTSRVAAIQWTGKNLAAIQAFMFPDSPLAPLPGLSTLGVRVNKDGGLGWVKVDDWLVKDDGASFYGVHTEDQFEAAFEVCALELVGAGAADGRD